MSPIFGSFITILMSGGKVNFGPVEVPMVDAVGGELVAAPVILLEELGVEPPPHAVSSIAADVVMATAMGNVLRDTVCSPYLVRGLVHVASTLPAPSASRQ